MHESWVSLHQVTERDQSGRRERRIRVDSVNSVHLVLRIGPESRAAAIRTSRSTV
jgi:hypothetical protein